jgi:membrane protein CcdC involved in cytochrome C biogenesis
MMDLALLSANANQLRYVIEAKERHPYYLFSMTFIIASLVFQVLVGVGLVLNSRYNVKNDNDICKADKINNLITVAILLVTIINVFISAFGVAELNS